MELTWDKRNSFLLSDTGLRIGCTCIVRNELNKWRLPKEVVHTKPDRLPYYPRVFPNGRWSVGRPIPTPDPYMAPFYIPTNAHQLVDVWAVVDGKYDHKTGEQVEDRSYGLHFASSSSTTLGCIRIGSKDQLLTLVEEIERHLEGGVWLNVRG